MSVTIVATSIEIGELQAAISANCTCAGDRRCSACYMLANEQRAINGLVMFRRLRARLLREEHDPKFKEGIMSTDPIQSSIEQLQQQQALQSQAMLYAVQGRWDAARYGAQSVEAVLVALNPALQGKVNPIPFEPAA